MTTPASDGPAIITTWKTILFSAIAGPSCSLGTSRGMNVCWAGALTALNAAPSATSAYSDHSGGATEGGEGEQHRRERHLADRHGEHQPPPVHPVGERSAGQRDQQQRNEHGDAEPAHRGR